MELPTRRPDTNERRAQHVARLRPLLALPLTETPDRIVPIAEVCIRLNKSRTTVWRDTRDGALPKPVDGGYVARDLVAARPELRGSQREGR